MKIRGIELWLLGALFIGPLLLAAALYYGPWDLGTLPRLEAEGRELFEPALALGPLNLDAAEPPASASRWSLIYATTTPCDAVCVDELARLRGVHLALGRRADRVRRVLLATGEASGAELGFERARLDANAAVLAALGAERLRDGEILIADPLGNIVLAYPPGAAQKSLLEDLKRLLEASRIG